MATTAFSPEILMYGFALFFIFAVLIMWIIRYSNKELSNKVSAIYEKIKLTEKDLRQLAEVEMRSKKELKDELDHLRTQLDELKGTKDLQKQLAHISSK